MRSGLCRTVFSHRFGQIRAWFGDDRRCVAAKYILLGEGRNNVEVDLVKVEEDMNKVLQDLSSYFLKVNSGRVNKCMFEQIMVQDEQRRKVPIQKYGSFVVKDAQSVVLNLYDASTAKCVLSALQQADLNLTARIEGGKVFVVIPKLTMEMKEQLAKGLSGPAEKAKSNIRDIRSVLIRSLDSGVKDLNLRRQAEQAAQRLYERCIERINDQLEIKRREIQFGSTKK